MFGQRLFCSALICNGMIEKEQNQTSSIDQACQREAPALANSMESSTVPQTRWRSTRLAKQYPIRLRTHRQQHWPSPVLSSSLSFSGCKECGDVLLIGVGHDAGADGSPLMPQSQPLPLYPKQHLFPRRISRHRDQAHDVQFPSRPERGPPDASAL